MTLLLLLSASLFATTIALFLPSLNEATKHKQQQVIPCLVSMCISRHSQLLEEHGILMPSPSADYCLLLKDYLTCLNDSRSGCLSQLDFHSAITSTSKRWRKFQCDNFEQKKLDQTECQFWEENEPQEETAMIAAEDYASDGHFDEENEEQEEEEEELLGEEHHSHDHGAAGSVKCAIFGQLHLRRFDSNVPEWCSFSGARPLFDHRFFLIQMTSAEVAGSKNDDKSVETSAAAFHVVSKIAIILRPREGCLSTQKLYLADATDAGQLSGTFEDGTSKVGGDIGSKIIVEIVLSELGQRADILLHHLATTIRVRKFGNNKFMNILIQTPKRLLNMNYESKHLCGDGCWDSSDDFADGAHQQNHVHVHPPPLLLQSCEQQIIDRRAQDHCSRLLIGRPELRGEWTQLCVRELLHSTKSFTSADLAKSLGMTLEDLFGLNINGTELAYDQEEMRRKGEEANKCPNNLTTTTIPFSPMSPTSSCPFPHISAAVLLLCNFALLLSTAKSVFPHLYGISFIIELYCIVRA